MPPDQLTTTQFVAEAEAAAARLNARGRDVACSVLSGEALKESGYGMLWAVRPS